MPTSGLTPYRLPVVRRQADDPQPTICASLFRRRVNRDDHDVDAVSFALMAVTGIFGCYSLLNTNRVGDFACL